MKNCLTILITILSLFCQAQNGTEYLTEKEVKKDLAFLDAILQNKSSYQGLNGYDYKKDFDTFLENKKDAPVSISEFGLFLSQTLGKIGDRHSYIKGYDLPESLYLPLAFAPLENKIVVLNYNKPAKEYTYWNPDFPYLKSINGITIEKILPQILPEEILAPKSSYLLHATRDLRDIETIFAKMNLELPNPLSLTLTDAKGKEKKVSVQLVPKAQRARVWDERFQKQGFFFDYNEEQRNDISIIQQFFRLENNIGYIQLPSMVGKEDSPVFFDALSDFMLQAKDSDALIVDVRDNGGGTRDLIQELAGYFIRPDAVHVVNATKQRGKLPLNKDAKDDLHSRYLFSRNELDPIEQSAVDQFMTSFKPMYLLDKNKFSAYHYYVLNGNKVSKDKFHYDKPIYILTNERTFSAASILVSVFQGLPNIKIVGVNTDGSSGNAERFELPKSHLQGKISTMVSYQKNGQVLDGIGTKPDILIERNLDQILWREDYQLNRLLELIRTQ